VRAAGAPRDAVRRRIVVAVALAAVGAVAAAWRWQSELIGVGACWYLGRVAAADARAGDVAGRRAVLLRVHRALLLPPPPPATVAELFDYAELLAYPLATGDVSLGWAGYLYTSHLRDLVRDRPTGEPRRSRDELRAELAGDVDFFTLRRRPDVAGVRVRDLLGVPARSYTADEIERAAREGRTLDLR
jgi:hypothetical protein